VQDKHNYTQQIVMMEKEHHISVLMVEKVKLRRKYSYMLTEYKKRRVIVNNIIIPLLLRFTRLTTGLVQLELFFVPIWVSSYGC
jgi:hypothetical protein